MGISQDPVQCPPLHQASGAEQGAAWLGLARGFRHGPQDRPELMQPNVNPPHPQGQQPSGAQGTRYREHRVGGQAYSPSTG